MAAEAEAQTPAHHVPADTRLRSVWDAVTSPAVAVVSTDVFDTLIWRQVPEPVDAFPLVGERLRERGMLAGHLTPEAFAQLRSLAEHEARRRRLGQAGDADVRLAEIYGLLPRWVFDWRGSAADGVEVELEVERELVVPDLDVVALLKAAQDAGKVVIAVSDIYFSEVQLRSLLAQSVLARLELDRVFTSSDHRIGKSGGLFDIVLRELGVSPGEVVHLGDNPEADMEYPGALGIRTFLFERLPEPLAAVMRREQRFLPPRPSSAEQSSQASGLTASRAKVLFRAERSDFPRALQPYWDYGAVVLGPIFTGFGEWVHRECRRSGIGRVLCLMREGGFLSEVIQATAGAQGGPELEATPAWLNRSLCLRAAVSAATEDEILPLTQGRVKPTVERLLRSLGLELSDVPSLAGQAATSLDDPVVRRSVLDAVTGDARVRGKVVAHAEVLRGRVAAYLESLAGTDGPVALVDLGWSGSIQAGLGKALAEAGRGRGLLGLYLVTHEGAASRAFDAGELRGFLADFGAPGEPTRLIMRSPELLEQVCMPAEGSQTGLDAELEPVLSENGIPRAQQVQAATVRAGILAFARQWDRYERALPGQLRPLAGATELLRPILVRATCDPTQDEAAHLGSWHHDENLGSSRTEVLAEPSAAARLRYMSPQQARDLPMTQLYWPFGLAAQVDEHWPKLMAAAAAGQIPWESFGSVLETGEFRIEVSRGVDADPASRSHPVRNRLGLSWAAADLRASHIQEINLSPSQRPAVLRIDFVELRCWVQGHEAPVTVRLDGPEGFGRLEVAGAFRLQPNVFIVHDGQPALRFDLARVHPGVVFRVEVECGFAALPTGALLPAGGRFANIEEAEQRVAAAEAVVRDMRGSASWRLTRPLRAGKRVLRDG